METREKSNIISENDFLKSLGISVENTNTPEQKENEIETTSEENIDKNQQPDPLLEDDKKLNDESTQAEEAIKVEEEKSLKRFGVKDTINSLIENDIWSDIAIKFGDKQYESIEELLANEKPTRELFDSLSQVQKTLREEKIKEEYISIKGKDETKVKLINAILSDVDYDDLLQYNKQVVEPVKKLDFANHDIKITENFVRQCLKDISNLPEKYINAEIEELKRDFKLIEKAEEFQEEVIRKFNEELDLRKRAEDEIRAREEEERSNNIKSFKKVLKDKEFSDSFIQKAAQLRYSKESDGKYHYEKLLEDKLKDGEFASKFVHFLLDEQDFLNREKAKVKSETTKKIMELVHIIPKEKGAKATVNPQNLSTADEEFLNEINK